MDPAIDLPNVLLNVLGSVQEENFLQGWRLYAENGHTNIVLKFLPKEQPLPHTQGAKNSTMSYLKHKSPAKISRGSERAKEFYQSKQLLDEKDHTVDMNLEISDKASDPSISLIDSNAFTLSTNNTDMSNCAPKIGIESEEMLAAGSQIDVSDKNIDKQEISNDSGIFQSKVLTDRECLSAIVSTPDGPECSSEPDCSDLSSIFVQNNYLNARNFFHTKQHNKSALRCMLKLASEYDISDSCIHLKMGKDLFKGNYNFSVF